MNVNYFLLNGAFKGVKLLLTVIVSSLKIGTGLSIHAFKYAYESYPTMRDRSKSLITSIKHNILLKPPQLDQRYSTFLKWKRGVSSIIGKVRRARRIREKKKIKSKQKRSRNSKSTCFF